MPRRQSQAAKDVKSRIQAFNDVMESADDPKAWRKQYDAMRKTQKGKTGIYNPKTGEREYGAFSRNRKDMHGRRYGR